MSQYNNSFSTFSQPYNATVKSRLLRVSLRTEMTDFSTLSYTSTSEIPILSFTWSLKRYPFRAEPSRMAIIGNTPRLNTCQSQPIKADYGRAIYTPRVVFLYAGLRFCVHRYSKVDPLTENPLETLIDQICCRQFTFSEYSRNI